MRVSGMTIDAYTRSHAGPSECVPTVRTDVRIREEIDARAAHARRPAPHSLVPIARGRLRRRLGGRPGRVFGAAAPAPSGAARARRTLAAACRPASRRTEARSATLHLTRRR